MMLKSQIKKTALQSCHLVFLIHHIIALGKGDRHGGGLFYALLPFSQSNPADRIEVFVRPILVPVPHI